MDHQPGAQVIVVEANEDGDIITYQMKDAKEAGRLMAWIDQNRPDSDVKVHVVSNRSWTAAAVIEAESGAFPDGSRCESGWTGDRCTYALGHEGEHSNE